MDPRKANSNDVDQQVHKLKVIYISESNHLLSQQIQCLWHLDTYAGNYNMPMLKEDRYTLYLLSECSTLREALPGCSPLKTKCYSV